MYSTLGGCGCRRFTLASLGGALYLAFIRSLLRVRTKRGSVLGESAHCEVLRLLVVIERLLLADIAKEIASEISPWIRFGSAHKSRRDSFTVIHFSCRIEAASGFAASCNDGSSKGDAVRKCVRGVYV